MRRRGEGSVQWLSGITLGVILASGACAIAQEVDPLAGLQDRSVETRADSTTRPYHFGAQGNPGVFSNHTSHSNRLVPVYTFGRKLDLGAVMGPNSRYRTEVGVRSLYGRLPEHTVNPEADYADQSDLYRVQNDAVNQGVKYLFTIWFDGLDWETTQAAAVARTGKVYREGRGAGLAFQDETAEGSTRFGYVVTSPSHADPRDDQFNVDTQVLKSLEGILGGGYDPRFAGSNPWTPGPLLASAAGYLKGHSATPAEREAVKAAGGVMHAYTDSAPSAGEYSTGVKMFNNSINVADDGRVVPTLFNQLQNKGWKVGTVTNVPFDHASPAAMYAHNVSRDDYQDLGREMLGLRSIIQETGRGPALSGLDVVIGAGWGNAGRPSDYEKQGENAVPGNMFLALTDLAGIDVDTGGKYVVAQRQVGVNGSESLARAAARAARDRHRLFGFYGLPVSSHLPYRTANGDYKPVRGIRGVAEKYSDAELQENPTLADMTRAALTVLSAEPGKPFSLFVEAGDVDFALHDNNLDNAIGAITDGEEAFRVIVDWVTAHSNWDESAVIVTADHGHYLVVDDPEAIARAARAR